MRRTLSNHQEVAHYWANEVQEEGHGCNMFFYNRTIYSYGEHFPIAKHYDNDLILFTNQGYSVSMSKHISYTRQAIPHNKTILSCYDPSRPSNQSNYDEAISNIEYNLKKAIKARSRKLYYINEAERAYNNLVTLKDTFKIKGWKIPTYDFTVPENIMVTIRERHRKDTAKLKRQQVKQRKQDKLDMVVFLEDVEAWRYGKKGVYEIRHRRLFNQCMDFCRVISNVVETTQSANAPLKDVRIALKRIAQGKSVKGMELGHYTVISYVDEVLTVGCHKFPKSEIDYLIKELNIKGGRDND